MSEVMNKSEKVVNAVDSGTDSDEHKANNTASAGEAGNGASATESSPTLSSDNKKTPAKRTPSKRMSFIERAQKESEELVKTMGGSLELEGGRRTRSSTRGTPSRAAVVTPPPAKKARNSPATTNSATPRARGRGRKLNTSAEDEKLEEAPKPGTESASKTEVVTNDKAASEEVKSPTQKGDSVDGSEKVSASADVKGNGKALEVEEKAKEPKTVVPVEKKSKETTPPPPTAQTQVKPQSKTASEATKVNVGNGLKESEQTSDKVTNEGSPMDTDEPEETTEVAPPSAAGQVASDGKPVSALKTTPDEPVLAAKEKETSAKEPTPEPMEVDSNSKSNDAVAEENTEAKTVEKANKTDKPDKGESNAVEPSQKVSAEANAINSKPAASEVTPAESGKVGGNADLPVVEADSTSKDTTADDAKKTIDAVVNAKTTSDDKSEVNSNSNEIVETKSLPASDTKAENDVSKVVKEPIAATKEVNSEGSVTATAPAAAAPDSVIPTPQSCN